MIAFANQLQCNEDKANANLDAIVPSISLLPCTLYIYEWDVPHEIILRYVHDTFNDYEL